MSETPQVVSGSGTIGLAELLMESGDFLLEFGADARCQFASPNAAQLLKRHDNNLIGERWTDVLPASIREALGAGCHTALSDIAPARVDVPVSPAHTWMEVRCWRRSEGGVVFYGRDISERHELEERLRLALDATDDGLWDWHISQGGLFVNGQWLAMLGYSGEEFNGEFSFWESLVHPDDRENLLKRLREHSERKLAHFECEHRLRHKDGFYVWVLSRGRIVSRTETGAAERMVGTNINISERQRLEREREELLADAVRRAEQDSQTGLLNHRAFHDRLHWLGEDASDETPIAVMVMDIDSFKFFNDTYGHTEGDNVLEGVARSLEALFPEGSLIARLGSDEFAAALPGMRREMIEKLIRQRLPTLVAAWRNRSKKDAVPVPMKFSCGIAFFPGEADSPESALALADARLLERKRGGYAGLESLRRSLGERFPGFSLLDSLVSTVDVKDMYTRQHSEDVLLYAQIIAQEVGCDDDQRALLQVAALLLDVGKVGIPDRILRLPTRLTEAEHRIVQQHAALGASLISAVMGNDAVTAAVRYHHEAWDGTGYPEGLSAESIPLMARILAIADAFSALTTDRPYRRGLSRDAAIAVLEAGAGSQWDPNCISFFLKRLGSQTPAFHGAGGRV
jgi:diguanylate cyclase (GGDEF)-like protein/PAS domain S-box-containing protein